MGDADCEGGIGEVRWIEVGNILDSDCIPCPNCTSADSLGPAEAVRTAARPWVWSWPRIVPLGDSDDCAPWCQRRLNDLDDCAAGLAVGPSLGGSP